MTISKRDKRIGKRYRIRKTISGTAEVPRLSVFRSNKDIYAQLIDDVSGKTIASASSREDDINSKKINKVEKAIANKAKEAGVDSVKFDRGGFLYHGRIKSLADGAREIGLKF